MNLLFDCSWQAYMMASQSVDHTAKLSIVAIAARRVVQSRSRGKWPVKRSVVAWKAIRAQLVLMHTR